MTLLVDSPRTDSTSDEAEMKKILSGKRWKLDIPHHPLSLRSLDSIFLSFSCPLDFNYLNCSRSNCLRFPRPKESIFLQWEESLLSLQCNRMYPPAPGTEVHRLIAESFSLRLVLT